jgi:hypothetical protein
MSRKRVFAGAENWKTLAGRVAWYYGKITDLQITAEAVEKGTLLDPVIPDFSFIGSTQKIPRGQPCAGSSPTSGTNYIK